MVTGKKIEDLLDSFKKARPEKSELVLAFRSNSLSAFQFDLNGSLSQVLHHNKTELPKLVDALRVTGKDYEQVRIFHSPFQCTLTPLALASEGLSGFLFPSLYRAPQGQIHTSRNEDIGFELSYPIDETRVEELNAIFPQAEHHHITELVLHTEVSELKHDNDFHFRAHIEEDTLFILGHQGRKLSFFNSFNVNGKTDILYYILHSMDALGVDHQSVPLHLSGYYDEMDELIELVRDYSPESCCPEKGKWLNTLEALVSKHRLCAS